MTTPDLLREARERYARAVKGVSDCGTIMDSLAVKRSLADIPALLDLVADRERLREELKLWRPMTPQEAEQAFAEAKAEPMSKERIEEIVKRALDPAECIDNFGTMHMASKIEQQAARIAELEADNRDLRDALRLRIGMERNRPWHAVAEADVDGWLEHFRRVKGAVK